MKNKVLVAVLGICTAVCTVAVDYAYTEHLYAERIAEDALYESLDADPHTLYGGFTVEELGEGYDKPSSVFGKVILDVPIINQFPELPIGCEVTSAAGRVRSDGRRASEHPRFHFPVSDAGRRAVHTGADARIAVQEHHENESE